MYRSRLSVTLSFFCSVCLSVCLSVKLIFADEVNILQQAAYTMYSLYLQTINLSQIWNFEFF